MTASPAAAATRHTTLAVIVACAAQVLVGVDGLAVAIALPALQTDLGVAPIDAQWVLSAYGLAFGGTLLLGGRLGDLYGRRRMLVCGMAVFAAASLLSATAPSLAVLVGARALQGLGAAAGVPAALALIGSLFPPGPQRTRALSLLAAMTSVGVISGLVIGGIVTDLLGWRWVFATVAAPAAIAAFAAPVALPEARAERPPDRLDVGGAVLATTGLLLVLFAMTRLEREGVLAAVTLVPLVAGAALLATFVAWERRQPAPLLRLAMLRVASLRTAVVAIGLNAIAFTSIVYLGTLYLQSALGYSPLGAALALLPVDVVAFAVPLLARDRLARASRPVTLAVSFAFTAAALAWLARTNVPADYVVDVMLPLVVLGASLSIAFVLLTTAAVADVSSDEKGVASGLFETSNHLFGGAVGVAVYATVLTASGYGAAFLTAAALAGLGVLTARGA